MKTLPVRTFYLEMRQPPAECIVPPPGTQIERLQPCPLEVYRRIYTEVGTPWGWFDRLLLPPGQLRSILDHPRVEVLRLTLHSDLAGFAELDCRALPEIELAYLGIVPALLGRKLGPYLLNAVLHRAWAKRPTRVWLHTCQWDHPAALRTYQQAGFKVYQEQVINQPVL